MTTRRQFLKTGILGTLALSMAGRWYPVAAQPSAFAADARADILAALAPVMLADALPAVAEARKESIGATLAGVDQAIAGLDPMAQKELGELFALLSIAPARWLLTGVGEPWSTASPAQVARFLQRWRHSFWALPQSAYQALHQLIFAAWYGQTGSWADIGYPGPPRLE